VVKNIYQTQTLLVVIAEQVFHLNYLGVKYSTVIGLPTKTIERNYVLLMRWRKRHVQIRVLVNVINKLTLDV